MFREHTSFADQHRPPPPAHPRCLFSSLVSSSPLGSVHSLNSSSCSASSSSSIAHAASRCAWPRVAAVAAVQIKLLLSFEAQHAQIVGRVYPLPCLTRRAWRISSILASPSFLAHKRIFVHHLYDAVHHVQAVNLARKGNFVHQR